MTASLLWFLLLARLVVYSPYCVPSRHPGKKKKHGGLFTPVVRTLKKNVSLFNSGLDTANLQVLRTGQQCVHEEFLGKQTFNP